MQQLFRELRRFPRSLVAGALALAVLPFLGSCSTSSSSASAATIPALCPPGTAFREFVVNSVTLPIGAADFAVDLNGDSIADNGYQAIVAAFAQQGIDSQAVINQAISSGNDILLVQQASADPMFLADTCATATIQAGVPTAPPDFSGNGMFTAGPGPAVQFTGPLAAGIFQGRANPAQTTGVVFQLPFGGVLVPVTLVAAQVKYTIDANGLLNGQVNGAILASDLPAIMNQATAGNPTVTIDPTLFDPDVQLYDSMGFYAPNAANTSKDSLSVGFGFTAVNAVVKP